MYYISSMNGTEQERKIAFQKFLELKSIPKLETTVEPILEPEETDDEFLKRVFKLHWWQLTEEELDRKEYILQKSLIKRYAQELLEADIEELKSEIKIYTVDVDKLKLYLNEIEENETHPIIKRIFSDLCSKYIEQGYNSLDEVEKELFNSKVVPNIK